MIASSFVVALAVLLSAPSPSGPLSPAPEPPEAGEPAPWPGFDDAADRTFLYEVARHLYRWYLDERDVAPEINRNEFVFWVREDRRALDEGDKSRFAEITLPRLGVQVLVKASDYEIPELDLHVASVGFKIVNVARVAPAEDPPADARVVVVPWPEMRDHLFRTRNAIRPPAGLLRERMRSAARKEIAHELEHRGLPMPEGEQVVHLAPLSPVANEAWVFWETGRLLIRFSADIDLASPALWAHEELAVDLFDIDTQVVVSLDEAAGSNAYLTRDQVGRVLYNAIVLGQRLVLDPPPDAKAPAVEPPAVPER
ncbi:MAG: hypothetical protein KDA22_12660 [Phycisphaerales bacterium]|nr:hypothetical protein [Phycisphaerales bacterium]